MKKFTAACMVLWFFVSASSTAEPTGKSPTVPVPDQLQSIQSGADQENGCSADEPSFFHNPILLSIAKVFGIGDSVETAGRRARPARAEIAA